MVRWCTALLVIGVALGIAEAEDTAAETIEPVPVEMPSGPHPRVFATPEEVESARQRAATLPWAQAGRRALLEAADRLVAAELDIPREGGQWTHWFTCPDDGTPLNSTSPTTHRCRTCGQVYSGHPYDAVYVTGRHNHWLSAVETLGLAYALEPQAAYAERARDILLEYADFYESLPLHDVHGGTGSAKARLFAQTLDESVALCRVCVGADFLWDSETFTHAVRRTIRRHLLMPMVDTIRANDRGISNWQSWHNAAVASVGFLLRERALVDWAVNGSSGFSFQMRRAVLPDGMWYEVSPSYHWYALRAHLYVLEAASRAGMDLYAHPTVKRMFDAPLDIVLPDGTFPPINDSDRHDVRSQRRIYEYAYRRYGDPRYLHVLDERLWPEALFWGADPLPEAPPLGFDAGNVAVDGLAILRDRERGLALYLDYSPGLSGHVHPAKLNLVLYAHGDIRLVDPGRLAYGNPLHRAWYIQSVAHNTVVVGCENQEVTGARLERLGEAAPGFDAMRAVCDSAYPGVVLERTVVRHEGVVLDVVRGRADGERTFDLPLHFRGAIRGLPAGWPLDRISDKPGYSEIKNPLRLDAGMRGFDVDTGDGRRIHVQVFDESEAFAGEGYGNEPTELLPMVLRRQRGEEAVFVTVYQVLEPGAEPLPVSCVLEPRLTATMADHTIELGEEITVRKTGGLPVFRGETPATAP